MLGLLIILTKDQRYFALNIERLDIEWSFDYLCLPKVMHFYVCIQELWLYVKKKWLIHEAGHT